MATLESIRSKLENKVFQKIGSTVILSSYVSGTTSKWGDKTVTYGANTNVTAVPYNLVATEQDFNPFGVANQGETDIVFKYDQALTINDKVTYASKVYRVKMIEKYLFNNGYVAQLARLAETLTES